MIKINGKNVDIRSFPDGTLLIKEEPLCDKALVSWFFERNEELVALIFITQHLRSHGAKDVRLHMPYIPNARQDRVRNADDVFTLKYFADIINSLEYDEVIVLDPHSSVSEALFNNIRIDSPDKLIKNVYSRVVSDDMNPSGKDTIMFYPDEGAMKRYSSMITLPYAFGIKERDWSTGKIKGLYVFDEDNMVQGRNILIVDDICSRGGTFYHSAKRLKELGAERIFLYVTHCENTIMDGEVLTSGLIDRVYTTNSIFTKEHERIEVIEL